MAENQTTEVVCQICGLAKKSEVWPGEFLQEGLKQAIEKGFPAGTPRLHLSHGLKLLPAGSTWRTSWRGSGPGHRPPATDGQCHPAARTPERQLEVAFERDLTSGSGSPTRWRASGAAGALSLLCRGRNLPPLDRFSPPWRLPAWLFPSLPLYFFLDPSPLGLAVGSRGSSSS